MKKRIFAKNVENSRKLKAGNVEKSTENAENPTRTKKKSRKRQKTGKNASKTNVEKLKKKND